MNTAATRSIAAAAMELKRRGREPLWVPGGSKNPGRDDWQLERLTKEEIPLRFAKGGNLSILTGEPSNGLVDVDLDASEAVELADVFLPSTNMVHGRPGNPRSHHWYVTSPVPGISQWRDVDGIMLLELRGTGGHTIIPPSTHPEGDTLVWYEEGEPSAVSEHDLRQACSHLAATALLARHWPGKGSRHHAGLAVGGYLLRGGLGEDLVVRMVETAARVAGDEEWKARGRDVVDTARNRASGKMVTGGPTAEILLQDGSNVVGKLRQWLDLRRQDYPMNGAWQEGPGQETLPKLPLPWEAPLPFVEIAGPPFPSGIFARDVQEFVDAEAEALQVPVDLPACLALGVGAAAAAGRCKVRLTQDWAEPLNHFVVVVLPSGERKSPAFRAMTSPLEERERELAMSAQLEISSAQTEAEILQTRLHDAKNKAAKAKSEEEREKLTKDAADLAGRLSKLSIPLTPRLLADDATSEAVASLLAANGGRIAVMSSEGGLFETLAGRYSQGTLNIDVYLKGFSGDSLRVDRKSRTPEFVPRPALTLVLTIQPDVIRDLAAKRGFRGRGLLARFLYSIPRSMVGYRSNSPSPVPQESRERWHRIIKNMLKLPDPPDGQEHAMLLSDEAESAFQQYRDLVETRLRPGADLNDIQDWANKLCGAVARLAGILHLFLHHAKGHPWEVPISLTCIQAAIRLGDYFSAHAGVAFSMMGDDADTEKARKAWAFITYLGLAPFSQRDLWQHVRRSFSVDELAGALQLLVQMGYLRRLVDQSHPGPGRPRSPIFEVNPIALAREYPGPSAENFEDSGDFGYTQGPTGEQDVGEV